MSAEHNNHRAPEAERRAAMTAAVRKGFEHGWTGANPDPGCVAEFGSPEWHAYRAAHELGRQEAAR